MKRFPGFWAIVTFVFLCLGAVGGLVFSAVGLGDFRALIAGVCASAAFGYPAFNYWRAYGVLHDSNLDK